MLDHLGIDSVCFSNHLARYTHHERVRWNNFSFGHESAGGNNGSRSDDRAVEHDSPDADQAIVFHARSVNDRSMSDGDPIADLARVSRVAVKAAEVLNVGLRTDLDSNAIASNHGPEQHARLGTNLNIASQGCVFGNETIVRDEFALKCSVHERLNGC